MIDTSDPTAWAYLLVGTPADVADVDPEGLFPTGVIAFIQSLRAYFMLDRASTATPDGVYAIAPAAGCGNWLQMVQGDAVGNLVLQSGRSLMVSQAGTPESPQSPITLWQVTPQSDPTNGPKAPFAAVLAGQLFPTNVYDSVLGIGYNTGLIFSPTEPQVGISIEQDYKGALRTDLWARDSREA